MFHVARFGLLTTALLVCGACAGAPRSSTSPGVAGTASDGSPLCRAALNRFVGVPAPSPDSTGAAANALAGRWWIRSCAARRVEEGLGLELSGPGWYFVDHRATDFTLRQQLGFTLAVALEGAPRITMANGVAALRFEPRAAPHVDLQLDGELNVRPASVLGTLLTAVPVVSVRDMAAEQVSAAATNALRAELSRGATATYDFGSWQSDVALGELRPGQVPKSAFTDGARWLVNERLFLPPTATQVVGPIDPGPTRMDVRVEQGSGVAYRTLCRDDMPAQYAGIASGQLGKPDATAASGTAVGLGDHAATFRVDGCAFYVVFATSGDTTTVASVRVRG